jgi:hypothetical protein
MFCVLLFSNKCVRMWVTEELLVDANFEYLTAIWTAPCVCYRVTYCRLTVTDVSEKRNASIFWVKQSNARTLTECISPKFLNYLPVDMMSRNTCILIYYPSITYHYCYVLSTTINLLTPNDL